MVNDKTNYALNKLKASSGSTVIISDDDIRTWLGLQDQKVLLDMLMLQLALNGQLREELVLKISKEKAFAIDLNLI